MGRSGRRVMNHDEEDDENVVISVSMPDEYENEGLLRTTDTPKPAALKEPTLIRQVIAEMIGTAILVGIGCGGLCMNKFVVPADGIWQCAVIFALGATLAVYATASVSGAHLNPAVTLSFAIVRFRDFSFIKVIPYMIAQFFGAILAGAINYSIFYKSIKIYETKADIVRGTEGSQKSADTFGCFYMLNPYVTGAVHAFYIEALGTAFLTFMIFAATRKTNNVVPAAAVPPIVGFSIGMMVALLGGLTGSGINPARDFGPRLVTFAAGWKGVSMDGWWVYMFAPLVGGPIGAAIAEFGLV